MSWELQNYWANHIDAIRGDYIPFKNLLTLKWNTLSFKEPFKDREDIFDFLSYLLRNWVVDIRIFNQYWVEVEIDEMIWETTFWFSDEAINVIWEAFERLHWKNLTIFSDDVSETVSFLVSWNWTIQ